MFIPETINVLYIEDDPLNAEITKQMLSESPRTKFNIVYKDSLKQGLEYLFSECKDEETCKVDIILLDLMLPNSRGVNTYKSIKEACEFLPVVIISGHEDIACECVKMGAQDYLLKDDTNNSRVLSRSLKYAIERHKIKAKLYEAKEKYKDLVEATHAAIYEIDFVNDRFTYVNDVMCQLTSWSKEEFAEMHPTELLTEESKKVWFERYNALKRGDFIPSAVEYEINSKDGETLWALVTAKYIENEDGLVVGARVVAIDITDKKIAQQEAEKKEEIIFSELESRIKEWREDITSRPTFDDRVQEINLNLMSITDKSEVL